MELLKIILLSLLLVPSALFAQNDAIVGTWTLQNSPITLPPGTALSIDESGSNFVVSFAFPIAIPAPLNCKISAGEDIVKFNLVGSGPDYTAQYFTFSPGSCSKIPLSNDTIFFTIAANGNSFTSCNAADSCLSWQRQGTAPGPISKFSVPPSVSPVGGKASISIAFLPVDGAYAYRVTIKGPVTLARTVKKGLFTKFTGLAKGSYKVTYSAFFKDEKGKVPSTKESLAIKVKVT